MTRFRRGVRKGVVPSQDVRTQADGSPSDAETTLADSAARLNTGMGAFGDGTFQGGSTGQQGYGQDASLPGGLGQGSGYAQSSGSGGYGQGAPEQGGQGESGSEQHNDERYSEFDGEGEQRGSQFGYGGRGTEQADGAPMGKDGDALAHHREAAPDADEATVQTDGNHEKPRTRHTPNTGP